MAIAGIAAQIRIPKAKRDGWLNAIVLCSKIALTGITRPHSKNITSAGNAPATTRTVRVPPPRRERNAPSAPHSTWPDSHPT